MKSSLTENEKIAITKYDLYYENRMSKTEVSVEVLKEDMKEIKRDLRWLLGVSIAMWGTLMGVMAKGFGWI